jgi:hypothetical protein
MYRKLQEELKLILEKPVWFKYLLLTNIVLILIFLIVIIYLAPYISDIMKLLDLKNKLNL